MPKIRKDKKLGYECMFTEPTTEETLELMRSPEISGYRRRTITAGEYREVEIYPLYRTLKAKRSANFTLTKEAQQKVNARNSAKHVMRMAHANFVAGRDLFLTLTYWGVKAPTLERAKKDIRNYLKAIRRARKRQGLPPLKYIYVIQFEEDGREVRVHHHLIMSEMDRDEAEHLWNKGRAQSDRLKPDDQGLAALAEYITRSKRGNKRVVMSRNLKKPTVSEADHAISRRQMERMVADCRIAAREIFEKQYPDWQFSECSAFVNDVFPGAHIYARMRKRPAAQRKRGCA